MSTGNLKIWLAVKQFASEERLDTALAVLQWSRRLEGSFGEIGNSFMQLQPARSNFPGKSERLQHLPDSDIDRT